MIITDDLLARSGGLNICQRVRGNPELADTPVIVMTARGSSASALAYFENGCDQLLRKPFRSEDIHYAIRKAVKKRQDGGTMIQVMYRSGAIDMVDARSLDRLVCEQELLCFRRQNGVAVIGRDSVRSSRAERNNWLESTTTAMNSEKASFMGTEKKTYTSVTLTEV